MSIFWKRSGMMIVVVFALVSLLPGCTRKDPDEGRAVMHAVIRDDIKSLDSANAYDEVSLMLLPNIMEALYQYDIASPTYRVVPLLAADMPTYSKDRMTLRIPIRKGVKFQDDPAFEGGKGRELKASDFVFAIKRLAHPGIASQGSWIFEGKLKGYDAFQKKLRDAAKDKLAETFEKNEIEGIRAVDDTTLELKLVKAYPQILHILTMTFVAPFAKEVATKYADELGQVNLNPVGTGPFRFEKYDRGHEATIVRNPSFRGDPMPMGTGLNAGKPMPFLDKIVFYVTKEDQPAWLKFMNGEIDFSKIPKDNFAQAITPSMGVNADMEKRGIKLAKITGGLLWFLNFNVQDKVLANKYLRQAIGSAVDRAKWIELFTNGRGQKMETVLPPGLPDRVENPKLKYDFDLARAKELMRKAGFPNGEGLPVITFDMRGADSSNRQLGEFFTGELAKIGVKLNVIYNTFPAFLEKKTKGQFQMSYGGWILDYPDAENVYQLLYASKVNPVINDSFFNNARYNSLFEKMAVMEPGGARAKVIREMDDLIQEEVPWAFGFYRDEFVLVNAWVPNFRASFFTRDGYKYYAIDQDLKKKRKR